MYLKEGDAAVFFLVCKLGSLFGGCLSSFAQAIFRAFLPSVRRNDVTDDVALARQRLAALRVGPARWAVVGGAVGGEDPAGGWSSLDSRSGSRLNASARNSGTRRSNHCVGSPGGRMPCLIRSAAKRGQWKSRCSTDSSQSLGRWVFGTLRSKSWVRRKCNVSPPLVPLAKLHRWHCCRCGAEGVAGWSAGLARFTRAAARCASTTCRFTPATVGHIRVQYGHCCGVFGAHAVEGEVLLCAHSHASR